LPCGFQQSDPLRWIGDAVTGDDALLRLLGAEQLLAQVDLELLEFMAQGSPLTEFPIRQHPTSTVIIVTSSVKATRVSLPVMAAFSFQYIALEIR
jgi:hypothetical protein